MQWKIVFHSTPQSATYFCTSHSTSALGWHKLSHSNITTSNYCTNYRTHALRKHAHCHQLLIERLGRCMLPEVINILHVHVTFTGLNEYIIMPFASWIGKLIKHIGLCSDVANLELGECSEILFCAPSPFLYSPFPSHPPLPLLLSLLLEVGPLNPAREPRGVL